MIKITKVYLAGPILSRTTEEANEWRQNSISELEYDNNDPDKPTHIKCLDPMRRQFSDEDMLGVNEIVQMDKDDVKDADIILVNYNVARQETTLVGTSMEIHLAYTLGKYIVAFTDLPKNKWSPWMIYHTTRICKSQEEAHQYIKQHF